MSWFARSLANSFLHDPVEEDDDNDPKPPADQEESGMISPNRGVKEDISEITKTLTRQLWGVASFLAPPPQSRSEDHSPPSSPRIATAPASSDRSNSVVSEESDLEQASDLPGIAGIRSDFAEIGGRFRSGISRLSSNKAVSEFSKIASTFLPFGEADEEEEEEEDGVEYGSGEGAIGVTEEVLTFARNISMHPETWLDFPLLPEEDESDDFDMSNAQQEHALAVERLAPRLAALRIELCPSHMSEGCFWKIYFVLLHPRLNKEDAERLSTPQVVEARAMLLQDLQNRTKSQSFISGSNTSYKKESPNPTSAAEHLTPSAAFHESTVSKTPALEEPTSSSPDFETDKHPVVSTEIKIVDKSVIEEEVPTQTMSSSTDASKVPIERYEDDADDWLQEEEGIEMGGPSVTPIPIGNEDDVSFSDLEDEDDQIAPSSFQKENRTGTSQSKGSIDWIQLGKNSDKSSTDGKPAIPKNESNEWLDVDDIDLE